MSFSLVVLFMFSVLSPLFFYWYLLLYSSFRISHHLLLVTSGSKTPRKQRWCVHLLYAVFKSDCGALNSCSCFKSLKKFWVVGDNQISSPSDYTSSLSLHVLYLICISACPAMLYPSLLCGFCCCTKWYVVYDTTGNMSWALNMSPPLLWSATFETRTWAAAPRHAKLCACVYVRTADQPVCRNEVSGAEVVQTVSCEIASHVTKTFQPTESLKYVCLWIGTRDREREVADKRKMP